ncbi:hypothetical protein QE152_g31340 [Popillia japonica]|uniref:Uncharacterized protein n=1 Tax=Popillia japonica TaxID=7064 RepID=A0AAW1J228_POPJA
MDEQAADLRAQTAELRIQRGQIKASLTRVGKFLEKHEATPRPGQVKARYDKLWANFWRSMKRLHGRVKNAKLLETISKMAKMHTKEYKQSAAMNVVTNKVSTNLSCADCNMNNHTIFDCKKFLSFEIPKGVTEVQAKRLCLNCLKANHNTSKCTSKWNLQNLPQETPFSITYKPGQEVQSNWHTFSKKFKYKSFSNKSGQISGEA